MKMYKSKATILLAAFGLLTMALLNQAFAANTIEITTDENVLSIHAEVVIF